MNSTRKSFLNEFHFVFVMPVDLIIFLLTFNPIYNTIPKEYLDVIIFTINIISQSQLQLILAA